MSQPKIVIKFTYESSGFEDSSPRKVEFTLDNWEMTRTEIIEAFEEFLRASGFYLKGHLEVVEVKREPAN